MNIEEFNFPELNYYLKNFDKEIFEKFEEPNTLENPYAGSLEDYFLGSPDIYDISWEDYYTEEGERDYSEEQIIELEKEKLRREFEKEYPGIKFNYDYDDFEEKFYIFPENQDMHLLYLRTSRYGEVMLKKFRERNIDETLLIKSISDKNIPSEERVGLIPLLSRRKVKNLRERLEKVILEDESVDCKHRALGELYSSESDISEGTLDYLLENFPRFTLSENLSFSLSVLAFGALKKRKNLDNKFIDILEISKNRISSRMKNADEKFKIMNLYLIDKDNEIFSDCFKVFLTYNPLYALEYSKINIKNEEVGWLIDKTIKKFFETSPLEEKRKNADYLIKQNIEQIENLIENSKDQIESKGNVLFPGEELRNRILNEHQYVRMLLNLRDPIFNVNHIYSEVKDKFIEDLEKYNAEFIDHLCNIKKNVDNQDYFSKVDRLIDKYAESGLPFFT